MPEGLQANTSDLAAALDAVSRGDREALRTLYLLTSAKLFGVCLRICGNRQAAEDILQDVYITIWQRSSGFSAMRGSPIAWMATIARNRSIDWKRSRGARERDHAQVDEALGLASDFVDPLDSMVDAQEATRLRACLDTLSDSQANTIRTAFFDGLTYSELAERTATPLGTVKSAIRRGMQRLKECLEHG